MSGTTMFGSGDLEPHDFDDVALIIKTLGVSNPRALVLDRHNGFIILNSDKGVSDSFNLTLDDQSYLPINDTHDSMVAIVLTMRVNKLMLKNPSPSDSNQWWLIPPEDRSLMSREAMEWWEDLEYPDQDMPVWKRAVETYEKLYGEKPL